MVVENFICVGDHCGLNSPVCSNQTFCELILVDCVDKGSPNVASYKSTNVIVMQYGNNNRLSFNHMHGIHLLFLIPPIISHVITLLDISSLARINTNCWKTTVFNLKKGTIE